MTPEEFRPIWRNRLTAAGVEQAQRQLDELLAHVLGCSPLEVPLHGNRPLAPAEQSALEAFCKRLEAHEPAAYILGTLPFHELTLHTDRRALIPRPETELLVEAALESTNPPQQIIDVCTGSGCIALALARARPQTAITAVDCSAEALELAQKNARLNGIDRIRWQLNDLLDGFAADSADCVVANPPYIPSTVCDTLSRSVREYEPRLALDGGPDGLQLIRRLLPQAFCVLQPGGRLLMEIGFDQGPAVQRLCRAAGFSAVRIRKDYAGHARIAEGVAP